MPGVCEIRHDVIVKYRNMSHHRYALYHLISVPVSQLYVMSFSYCNWLGDLKNPRQPSCLEASGSTFEQNNHVRRRSSQASSCITLVACHPHRCRRSRHKTLECADNFVPIRVAVHQLLSGRRPSPELPVARAREPSSCWR